jgi:hypothetical protein
MTWVARLTAELRAPLPESTRKLLAYLFLVVCVLGVIYQTFQLALTRHFQVDEFQNVANIAYLSGPSVTNWATTCTPWMIAMGKLIGQASRSEDSLRTLRLVFGAACVGNFLLMACAQPYLRSIAGRGVALLVFSSCWIFWRYGYEIRHDVFLTTANLLVLWLTLRVARSVPTRWESVAFGLVVSVAVASVMKAAVYMAPASALYLIVSSLRPNQEKRARTRALLEQITWGALGLGSGLLLCVGFVASSGHLDLYLGWLTNPDSRLGGIIPFSAYPRVEEYIAGSLTIPCALALPTFYFACVELKDIRRTGCTHTQIVAAFFALGSLAIGINPLPFPYNDIAVLPVLMMCVLDTLTRIRSTPIVALLIAVQLWSASLRLNTDHYINYDDEVQLNYIDSAEKLLAQDDPILDGVGMVSTRLPPGPDWLLHSTVYRAYQAGQRRAFKDYIREAWPPVILTNYRWTWLSKEEHRVLDENYSERSDFFFVLGHHFTPETHEFIVRREGRYYLTSAHPVELAGVTWEPMTARPLEVGAHTISAIDDGRIEWLGPHLEKPPVLVYAKGALFRPF